MERKKKLRLIQISLLFFGVLIIFFTYINQEKSSKEEIISKETQEKIQKQLNEENNTGDIFYNIEYSGLDLAGNRYILKSKEAFNNKSNQEVVNMRFVEAVFYFKDDTVLYIKAKKGIYNNKTFDMSFRDDVRAEYLESKLFAEKADFSNTKNYLTIYENVKINDIQGNLIADKVLFDITKQKVEIASFNKKKVNTNIKLK